jgi:hypothetical protein
MEIVKNGVGIKEIKERQKWKEIKVWVRKERNKEKKERKKRDKGQKWKENKEWWKKRKKVGK